MRICLSPAAPIKFPAALISRTAAQTRLLTAVSIVCLLAAGCSAPQGTQHPATTAPMHVSAPPSTAALTPRQQVIAAYNGYLAAARRASDSQNPQLARAFLAPYMPPAAISQLIRAFRTAWHAGEIAYGAVVSHVLGVRIAGDQAVVHDCQDGSHAGLQHARTRRVVPGTLGKADFNADVILQRVRGRWLYVSFIPLGTPCTP